MSAIGGSRRTPSPLVRDRDNADPVTEELDDLLAPFVATLPTECDGNHEFVFTESSIPDLLPAMRTNGVVATKVFVDQAGTFPDSVQFSAHRATFRALGVVVVAALFLESETSIELELTHPESDIKLIRIEAPWTDIDHVMRTVSFTYWPSQPAKHPWMADHPHPEDLPGFNLQTRDDLGFAGREHWERDQWRTRDTIVGFGSIAGTARLAALLLDIGNPVGERDEIRLEGEVGFRGVAPGSAEVGFWLPGSIGCASAFYGDADPTPT